VLAIILTVLVAVGVGVTIERRSNAIAHRLRELALQTMLWVLVPFVAYVNIARVHLTVDAGLSIAVAAATFVAGGALMALLSRGPLALARPTAGAAIVSTVQANTTYLGLPLCAALFGHAAFTQAVAFDALISAPMLVLGSYSIGAVFGHAAERGLVSRLRAAFTRNPILPAVVAGWLVPEAWAPHVLVTPAKVAVFALLPLGFAIVGITLADEAKDGTLRVPPPLSAPIAAVISLRMLLPPAVLALVGATLLDVPAAFLLLAAMPTGINTLVVAHATRLDLSLAAASIVWTTTLVLPVVAVLDVVGVVG
jgi:predicted permease